MGFQVAVDIGGTFTDLVALDDASGRIVVDKSPARASPSPPVESGSARFRAVLTR